MNIFRRLFGWRKAAPALRNRPGGLAWIKHYGETHGADVLAGRIVKTVCADGGFWHLDPPQRYKVHSNGVHCRFTGVTAFPGDFVTVTALSDTILEPIPEVGDDVRDEMVQLLGKAPPVPTHTKERA